MSKILNIEELMLLPDMQKEGKTCYPKGGGSFEIRVIAGSESFCESCGDLVNKSFRLGNSESKFCSPCFRKNQVDAEFE